jgi:hypothetical protein
MDQHEIEAHEVRYWGTIPATFGQREERVSHYVHHLQSLSPSDFATVALRVERILPLLHAGSRHTDLVPSHLLPLVPPAPTGADPGRIDFRREGWLERIRQVTREEAVRRGLFPGWPLPPDVDTDATFLPG